jgi:MerR family mercuric resistance operon transcriptional regulator
MNLTIGKLASQANVTIETIRYYQRKGLLVEPNKPATGYRQYPSEAISRLRFIKRAQQSGFSLKEIMELLSLDSEHCQDVQNMAEQKLQQIDEQLKDLTALRNVLDRLVKGCQQDKLAHHCSLIEAFSNQKDSN